MHYTQLTIRHKRCRFKGILRQTDVTINRPIVQSKAVTIRRVLIINTQRLHNNITSQAILTNKHKSDPKLCNSRVYPTNYTLKRKNYT
jgi:hypothetical protein